MFFYLLNSNTYSIYLFIFILFIYSILLSNIFILSLFRLYLIFKNNLKFLNSINLEPFINNYYSYNPIPKTENSYFKNKLSFSQSRNFNTSSKINNNINNFDPFEIDPELENMDIDLKTKLLATDLEFRNKYFAYQKNKELKEFKKIYKGGYLGYNNVYHFGNVSELINLTNLEHKAIYENLVSKLTDYLNDIPEKVVYSVLPVLRWQYVSGDYQSITVARSIKITRET